MPCKPKLKEMMTYIMCQYNDPTIELFNTTQLYLLSMKVYAIKSGRVMMMHGRLQSGGMMLSEINELISWMYAGCRMYAYLSVLHMAYGLLSHTIQTVCTLPLLTINIENSEDVMDV